MRIATTIGKFVAGTIVITARAFASGAGIAIGFAGAVGLLEWGYTLCEKTKLEEELKNIRDEQNEEDK